MSVVAAIRHTTDALGHATTGINALRASVPRDGSDAAPPAVAIYSEVDFAWVARGVVPRVKTGDGPLLLVRGPDEAEIPIFPVDGGEHLVEVRVLYVRRAPGATVESDDAVRDAYQTLRVAARSLGLLYTAQEAVPIRNGVDLRRPSLRLLRGLAPLSESAGDPEMITGALSITYPAVDPWAMASTTT